MEYIGQVFVYKSSPAPMKYLNSIQHETDVSSVQNFSSAVTEKTLSPQHIAVTQCCLWK